MPLIDEYFSILDDAIGEIRANLDKRTILMLISDHGFQSAYKQFDVNDWLRSHKLLKFRRGKARTLELLQILNIPSLKHLKPRVLSNLSARKKIFSAQSTISWKNTKAYCAGDQQVGIRVNLRGREPGGIVNEGQENQKLVGVIEQALLNTRDPENNNPVIRGVFRRHEYFHGPFSDQAPDLVFHTHQNYAISPYKKRLFELTNWASGDHSLEGVFIAHGNVVQKGKQIFGAEIVDLFPTILHIFELDIPIDIDGKVIKEIFEDS
jgi:predicted AlkP superfamily phosphohydrolase/phosphomutase